MCSFTILRIEWVLFRTGSATPFPKWGIHKVEVALHLTLGMGSADSEY
jgi:hypothetical protein